MAKKRRKIHKFVSETLRPEREVRQAMEELRSEVDAALHLLESEEADAIIGEQTEEYRKLIRGTSALMGMSWATMKTHGLQQVPESLKVQSQTLLMMSILIHNAYALGIRRGRTEAPLTS